MDKQTLLEQYNTALSYQNISLERAEIAKKENNTELAAQEMNEAKKYALQKTELRKLINFNSND